MNLSIHFIVNLGQWMGGQAPGQLVMTPNGIPVMLPNAVAHPQMMGPGSIVSGSDGGPPSYTQVINPYGAAYFVQHPGSIAPSQGQRSHNSGSNHSGSQKSGSIKKSQQRDVDQMTIRSSGSSERSHSSKGSKREVIMNDKTSLASFQADTISLRSEIMPEHDMAVITSNMAELGLSNPNNPQGIPANFQMTQVNQQIMPNNPQLINNPQVLQNNNQVTQSEPQRELGRLDTMPASMSASRQSFRMAMGNSSNEFFVDVM